MKPCRFGIALHCGLFLGYRKYKRYFRYPDKDPKKDSVQEPQFMLAWETGEVSVLQLSWNQCAALLAPPAECCGSFPSLKPQALN